MFSVGVGFCSFWPSYGLVIQPRLCPVLRVMFIQSTWLLCSYWSWEDTSRVVQQAVSEAAKVVCSVLPAYLPACLYCVVTGYCPLSLLVHLGNYLAWLRMTSAGCPTTLTSLGSADCPTLARAVTNHSHGRPDWSGLQHKVSARLSLVSKAVTCVWDCGLSPVSEAMVCHLWLWPVTCVWECGVSLSPVSKAVACHLCLRLWPVSKTVACHLCLRLWPVTCV